MSSVKRIVEEMRANPKSIRFNDCVKVCMYYFGEPRVYGSHHVFKMPWRGKPWVNIQEQQGNMKPYQVKQVLEAVDKIEGEKSV